MAKTKTKTKFRQDIFFLHELPALLAKSRREEEQMDLERLQDLNMDYISACGEEAAREYEQAHPKAHQATLDEVRFKAEAKAQDSLYEAWERAILQAMEALCEDHKLVLSKVDRRNRVRVSPKTTWEGAADAIMDTIHGVGMFEFRSRREFLNSGPYTARTAVLAHLGAAVDRPEVYGERSYQDRFQSTLERALRNL